jgi:hypothetical protein
VVAPGGADDFLGNALGVAQVLEIRQPAPDLERTDRCVVLVLDPAVGAQPLVSVAQRYCGVGPKAAYTVWAAASICESVGRSVMVFSGSSDIKCPSERDQALDAAHHIAAYPDLAAFVL